MLAGKDQGTGSPAGYSDPAGSTGTCPQTGMDERNRNGSGDQSGAERGADLQKVGAGYSAAPCQNGKAGAG